jgi:hypothetical protein
MWIPDTIDELLEERISFGESYIASFRQEPSNHKVISDFTKSLIDFKYCKRMLVQMKSGIANEEVIVEFKRVTLKMLLDMSFEIERQESKTICIEGLSHPLKHRSWLPEEQKNYSLKLKQALEKIYEQVKKM